MLGINEYIHPPTELIIAQYKCASIRPKGIIPGNRDDKRYNYAKARNMFLRNGIVDVNYIGLTSVYPDDIAISLHPLIKNMVGVEMNKTLYPEIKKYLEDFKKYSSFNIELIKENIFNIDPNGFRIIDLDFNRSIDWEEMEAIVELVCKLKTHLKVGLMVWCSYGMKNLTKNEQMDRLKILKEEISHEFHILDFIENEYVGNHIPIQHRSFVLKKKDRKK